MMGRGWCFLQDLSWITACFGEWASDTMLDSTFDSMVNNPITLQTKRRQSA